MKGEQNAPGQLDLVRAPGGDIYRMPTRLVVIALDARPENRQHDAGRCIIIYSVLRRGVDFIRADPNVPCASYYADGSASRCRQFARRYIDASRHCRTDGEAAPTGGNEVSGLNQGCTRSTVHYENVG